MPINPKVVRIVRLKKQAQAIGGPLWAVLESEPDEMTVEEYSSKAVAWLKLLHYSTGAFRVVADEPSDVG